MNRDADLCAAAAHNNALWCDAMARIHGAASTFVAGAWLNRRPAPRFHPNLVTLGDPRERHAHLYAVRQLQATPPAPGWAVKDSFASLDLAPLGFELLFEASWIYRPAGAFDRIDSDYRARRIASEDALHAWEEAWRAGALEQRERLFRPELLDEETHAVIALQHKLAIVAGCIASQTGWRCPDSPTCSRHRTMTAGCECHAWLPHR
ncbi:MAG: hypothetical protein R3D05_06565 [Dongiaceae bacterium]